MNVDFKKINLLIVVDDESLRDAFCNFFAKCGAKVFSASNGRKAMKIALVQKIDLILSDVRLPEMDGIELLKVIKAYSENIPLIWFMSDKSELDEESVRAI